MGKAGEKQNTKSKTQTPICTGKLLREVRQKENKLAWAGESGRERPVLARRRAEGAAGGRGRGGAAARPSR